LEFWKFPYPSEKETLDDSLDKHSQLYSNLSQSNPNPCHVYLRPKFKIILPEGRRPLGRPRRRWVDNIRMDLQEVGCGYMDWIGLAQDRDR